MQKVIICLALLLASCSLLHPSSGFLQTSDAGWNRCLDEKVSIHVDKVDLVELFCRTAAFEDVNIAIQVNTRTDQDTAASVTEAAAAEARAKDLRVSLNIDGISRRDLLYRIARLCSADMCWQLENGVQKAVLVVIR